MSSLGLGVWVGGLWPLSQVQPWQGSLAKQRAQLTASQARLTSTGLVQALHPLLGSQGARAGAPLTALQRAGAGVMSEHEILRTQGMERLPAPPPLPLALPGRRGWGGGACVCSTNARRYSERLSSELRIPQSTRRTRPRAPHRWWS